jgi:hypothetical protein
MTARAVTGTAGTIAATTATIITTTAVAEVSEGAARRLSVAAAEAGRLA